MTINVFLKSKLFEIFIGNNIPEAVVEITINNKVHDAIDYKQKMIEGCRAYEPSGRKETITTSNDCIAVKHFIQVE